MNKLQEPLNANERYLHGINARLNILIEMFSSFLDVYSKEEEVATSDNTYEEMSVEVEEEPEEVVEEPIEEEVEEVIEQEDFDYNSLTKAELIKELEIHGADFNKSMLKSELVEIANKYL